MNPIRRRILLMSILSLRLLFRYTSLCIGDALKNISVESKCFFYFTKNGQHFIPFQRLAEVIFRGLFIFRLLTWA